MGQQVRPFLVQIRTNPQSKITRTEPSIYWLVSKTSADGAIKPSVLNPSLQYPPISLKMAKLYLKIVNCREQIAGVIGPPPHCPCPSPPCTTNHIPSTDAPVAVTLHYVLFWSKNMHNKSIQILSRNVARESSIAYVGGGCELSMSSIYSPSICCSARRICRCIDLNSAVETKPVFFL